MAQTVQSIERAAAVLRLLAEAGRPLGVVEIASSLALAKGTAHGIIRTLHDVGFVDQDRRTGRYRLGAELQRLGSEPVDPNELRSLAMNWTDTLAARTRETVRIGVLGEHEAVRIVHHVFRPDDSVQVLEIGRTLPSHASALGKTLLAYTPGAAAWLRGRTLEPYTARTITDGRSLAAQLSLIRERGWSADVEELTAGEASIAAPIRDAGGVVLGAVGVTGAPTTICDGGRNPRPKLALLVVTTARAITGELASRRR
ncbi:MAG: IclR family transcriptional regulator [Nitriliruptoraceae bacterium]